VRIRARCLAAFVSVDLVLAACGGGGSGGSSPTGDFSLSVTSPTPALAPGTSLSVALSINQVYLLNPLSGNVSISVSGLPAGVTASPSTSSVAVGSSEQIVITAAASVRPTSASITFQGTDGSLSHSTQVTIDVVAPVTAAHAPIRTRFLRTDNYFNAIALTETLQPTKQFTTYDEVHRQFFVSNPYANEINVFDAATQLQTGQIVVPQPWGIDISPYNGSLYAATLIGDVYQIDTSTLSVTSRYPSASIGPKGFAASSVFVLSDGRLALQGAGWIPNESTYGDGLAVVWNPVTNAMDTGAGQWGICSQYFGSASGGAIAVSGDRTRLLTFAGEACSYDPIAQLETYGVLPGSGFDIYQIIPTPDGTKFIVTTNVNGIAEFDAKTVQLLAQNIGDGGYDKLPGGASSGVVSQDGKTLFLMDNSGTVSGAFSTASLNQTGWLPDSFPFDNTIGAIDPTGLIVGPAAHGVQFLDGSSIDATQPTVLTASDPAIATGPLSGGTQIANAFGPLTTSNATPTQYYVGNVPGFDVSDWGVTTPPSSFAGPVDLTVVLSDGATATLPEAFSYGPTILEVVPNGSTAEGGQTGTIVGYGFGNSGPGIQISIGGESATVAAVYDDPYEDWNNTLTNSFPTNAVRFTIPPGIAGSAVDVTVTTPSGTATAKGAFNYTAASTSYPLTAHLQSGIYDAGRNLYYFADRSKVQVLSTVSGQWQAPITLPGVSGNSQLMAISESPDGSKLAVSDYGGQAIYVLNPSAPSSAQRFPMSLDIDGFSSKFQPSGLAVTNSGMVYFAAECLGCLGAPLFHELNTAQGTIVDVGTVSSGGTEADQFDRVLLSPDGSRVYLGYWWYDTSTNVGYTVPFASMSDDFTDLAISGDGGTLELDTQFTDEFLNVEDDTAYFDWELWYATGVTPSKLNQDGGILFQPLTDGIDLLARNTGRLLYRIQIPQAPAPVYDPVVVAEGTNELLVITTAGVSLVDLSSLPVPSSYSQPFPTATRPRLVTPGNSNRASTTVRMAAGRFGVTDMGSRLRFRPKNAMITTTAR